MAHAYNFIDLTDQTFDRLYVKEFAYIKGSRAYWKCECVCGTEKVISGKHLRSGSTQSCGCLQKERVSECNTDKIFSVDHKKKLSDNAKLRTGNKNPRWNFDLTKEDRKVGRSYPEYIEWRKAIYERDSYTCQKCGDNKGGNLNAHHIESYRSNLELRIEMSNGITLCKNCHDNFHHQYGYGDNTKDQFEEFISTRSY